MDQIYLCNRIRNSLDMAGSATDSASRLVHFELAGRYSLLAAKAPIDPAFVGQRRCEHGASSFHRASPATLAL